MTARPTVALDAAVQPRVAEATARMQETFAGQREAFAQDMDPPREARIDRLRRLARMTERHERAIAEAISADFGHRAREETDLAEIFLVRSGIRHTRRHLRQWMQRRRVPTPLHMRPARSELIRQPLGVVGIISPWNYPFQLAVLPAVAALAAGNRVMIKPSELTPAFAELLRQIVGEFFSQDELAVVPGDVEVGRAFSRLPFDHLFFTGSTAVGRQVALAAAENLTPVTLELGGKSPVIVDADCDLAIAAGRIAYGKLFNAGQTCVAPDYALVPRGRVDAFVAAVKESARAMYPSLVANPDYTSIVSDRHYQRLRRLVAEATSRGATAHAVDTAAERVDAARRKFIPTLLTGVTDDMVVMREEIFGPVLPVVPYDTLDDAIAYVNRHPRPLAAYWFGKSAEARERVLRTTISGGVATNDVCWQVAQDNLPFGGVGASGQGAYHGERGFRTFSHEKAVFHQAAVNGFPLFRPPYGRTFRLMVGRLKRFF